ncbi:MAG: hypothetical protein SGBAC_010788 [Bacillariaceae sp.]
MTIKTVTIDGYQCVISSEEAFDDWIGQLRAFCLQTMHNTTGALVFGYASLEDGGTYTAIRRRDMQVIPYEADEVHVPIVPLPLPQQLVLDHPHPQPHPQPQPQPHQHHNTDQNNQNDQNTTARHNAGSIPKNIAFRHHALSSRAMAKMTKMSDKKNENKDKRRVSIARDLHLRRERRQIQLSAREKLNVCEIAKKHTDKGKDLSRQGRYKSAGTLFQQALSFYLQAHGEESHPDVAGGYDKLGACFVDQEKYDDALQNLRKGLDIRLLVRGDRDKDIAKSYNSMGNVLFQQQKYEEALKMYEHSLSIGLEKHGSRHLDVAGAYYNIGNTLGKVGKLEESTKTHEHALEIRLEALGRHHLQVAESHMGIGVALTRQDEHAKAQKKYEDVLSIYLQVHGEGHEKVASVRKRVAKAAYSFAHPTPEITETETQTEPVPATATAKATAKAAGL